MKNYKEILNDLIKLREREEKTHDKMLDLDFAHDRENAAWLRDYNKVKELREKAAANKEEVAKLSAKCQEYRIIREIMRDNLRYSLAVAGLEVLKEIMRKYDGKAYGEKTAQKIFDEMKSHGLTVFFERSFCSVASNLIEINYFNDRGFTSDYKNKGKIYVDHDTPFIDKDNKINYQAFEVATVKGSYCEELTKRAKAIIKAKSKLEKATAAAFAIQEEANELLPSGLKSFDNINKWVKQI